jgi:lipopolysaccharide transport system ATP-binding protein
MNDTVIRVEDLGKRYRIGQRDDEPQTFRDAAAALLGSPFRYLRQMSRPPTEAETLWALRHIAFEVSRGEVLGVIGRNGAGKSTLLKILSRITEPTEGRAAINGRVGSLLEVGTGFHPELTGRENIYLSGVIRGMKRREVERKLEEIIDFSGIERFLDTPVKRYSSGMYVRLGFAVAAHLEPEILIIDEVLAVGDAAFQRKCLGKMGAVAREGRTILFVSHNMVAMQKLCHRVLWLQDGEIVQQGESGEVVSSYLQMSVSNLTEQVWDVMGTAPGNDKVRLRRACVRPEGGLPSDPITMRTPIALEFEYWNLVQDASLNLNIHVVTEQGITAFASASVSDQAWFGRPMPAGLFLSRCWIPGDLLNSGQHRIVLRVIQDQQQLLYQMDEALIFNVQDSVERRGNWYGKTIGAVRPPLRWATELVEGQDRFQAARASTIEPAQLTEM